MNQKITTTTLLLSLITLTLTAQMNTFINTYSPTALKDAGTSILFTPEGDHVIAGISGGTSSTDNSNIILIRTDSLGDTLWVKTFGGDSAETNMRRVGLAQSPDSGFIIVGSTRSYGAGGEDVYLIKTDSNGDTTWTKTFGGMNDDFGIAVETTMDGGYILTGGTSSFGAGDFDVYLIKTNAQGDMIWNKTFGGSYYDDAWSVKQTADSGFILAGGTYSFGSDIGNTDDTYIIKTDKNGDSLWVVTYGTFGNYDWANELSLTTDGGYIITGISAQMMVSSYLLKIDAMGNMIWNNSYASSQTILNSVYATSDHGYIAGGQIQIGNDLRAYLVKTDSTGNVMWTRDFVVSTIQGENDQIYSVKQTPDGGYIFTGTATTPSLTNTSILMVKVDEIGRIITGIDDVFSEYNINVYPNPSNDYIRFDLKQFQLKNADIKIYDSIGKEIFNSCSPVNNQFRIPTNHFANGIYYYSIGNDVDSWNGKFVVNH